MSLSTLLRCQEVKGRQHHCNLLSWVTREVEKKDECMLSFTSDLVSLEQAARYRVGSISKFKMELVLLLYKRDHV